MPRPPVTPAALATPTAIASAASTAIVKAATPAVRTLLVGPLRVLNGRSGLRAGARSDGGGALGRRRGIGFRRARRFILGLRDVRRKNRART